MIPSLRVVSELEVKQNLSSRATREHVMRPGKMTKFKFELQGRGRRDGYEFKASMIQYEALSQQQKCILIEHVSLSGVLDR